VGTYCNLGVKAYQGKISNWKDGFVAFGIGAAAGAVTAATGGAATGAFGLSAASITGGAVAGATGSATGGLIQGLGNAAYFNDSYSAKEWAMGIGIGTLTGGIGGGIAARIKGNNLWWGTPKAPSRTIWSLNNSTNGGNASVGFGEIEFAGVDDYVLNAKGVALNGEAPIIGQSNTFAGQTARNLPTPYFPTNNGALGSWTNSILSKGQLIDRYGSEYGSYFSPRGTPLNMRALDYIPNGKPNVYEVLKSFPVEQSTIAPAFGKIGLGIQYKSPISVSNLIRLKYIRPVK
jgi:Tuberculosis necrotizing toxin